MSTPAKQLAWVNSLPRGWNCKRLKFLVRTASSSVDKKSYEGGIPVRLCNYTDVYRNEYIADSMEFMQATATHSEILRFGLRANDVIITKDSEEWNDIAVPACVAEPLTDVVCGYHLTVLRPAGVLDGRFLMRVLQASGVRDQFWVAATGVTRYGLSQQDIRDVLIPLPPPKQQKAIAAFLDQTTRTIDALIARAERLRALLHEKRLALICHAVTRGVGNPPRLKPSQFEIAGEIPAHWEALPLRRVLSRLEQGWSPVAEARAAEDHEWGVLKLSAINAGQFAPEEHKALPAGVSPLPQYEVKVGDLLLTRSNTPNLVGDCCVVRNTRPRLMISDLIYRLRLKPTKAIADFVSYFLQSTVGRAQVVADARGSSGSMVKVSQSHIRNWMILLPPVDEQRAIVQWLDHRTYQLSRLSIQIGSQIELFREYRQALITAAVTGQLTVPEEAA